MNSIAGASSIQFAKSHTKLRLGQSNQLWFSTTVVLLCLIPFALVLVISFGEKIEGADWRWAFDYSNYRRFFVGADWPDSSSTLYLRRLWFSFYYAIVGALLAVATAFPFAYLISKQSRAAQTLWLVFLLSAVSLSEVFVVMGWDILLSNRSGLPMVFKETGVTDWLKGNGGLDILREWGLANPRNVRFKPTDFATLLTMSYLVWPYAVILLYPALVRLDQSTTEAARTMGASSLTVIRTVVLPSVKIPVIGVTLLLFVFLLGSYVSVTVFAHPSRQTLAVSVYDSVRGATMNAPFGAAQSVILLITAVTVLTVALILGRRAEAFR